MNKKLTSLKNFHDIQCQCNLTDGISKVNATEALKIAGFEFEFLFGDDFRVLQNFSPFAFETFKKCFLNGVEYFLIHSNNIDDVVFEAQLHYGTLIPNESDSAMKTIVSLKTSLFIEGAKWALLHKNNNY